MVTEEENGWNKVKEGRKRRENVKRGGWGEILVKVCSAPTFLLYTKEVQTSTLNIFSPLSLTFSLPEGAFDNQGITDLKVN